ncbi:Dual specificity protein phosphatase cdc14b [Saguinus oedipus]|uniref:Dual specificity protein phosphatase cdc14b n=1 Tax=Saguinus oedipus TaxID=9490 RepID=A0ABQ9WCN1_SAGOE|nr:Dual specificity protein phosphatase cdc14b [Saguinus oedipus]
MKRKSERRSTWAAAPPCSRRCSSSSPGVKKSRSSAPQDPRRLDPEDDVYLDITGPRTAAPRAGPWPTSRAAPGLRGPAETPPRPLS